MPRWSNHDHRIASAHQHRPLRDRRADGAHRRDRRPAIGARGCGLGRGADAPPGCDCGKLHAASWCGSRPSPKGVRLNSVGESHGKGWTKGSPPMCSLFRSRQRDAITLQSDEAAPRARPRNAARKLLNAQRAAARNETGAHRPRHRSLAVTFRRRISTCMPCTDRCAPASMRSRGTRPACDLGTKLARDVARPCGRLYMAIIAKQPSARA
jgi:hypothetical protein